MDANAPRAGPKDLLKTALDGVRNGRELIIELPDGTRITTDGSDADYPAAERIMSERERIRVMSGGATPTPDQGPVQPATDGNDLMSVRAETHVSAMRGKALWKETSSIQPTRLASSSPSSATSRLAV